MADKGSEKLKREASKDPNEGTQSVLKFLIEAEGLSAIVLKIKIFCERRASFLSEQSTTEKYDAPKYIRAADEIEKLFQFLKYEERL
jgi:hypothetical protein